MISFAVTVKLICAYVFAYAICWFSHDMAQIIAKALPMHAKNLFFKEIKKKET